MFTRGFLLLSMIVLLASCSVVAAEPTPTPPPPPTVTPKPTRPPAPTPLPAPGDLDGSQDAGTNPDAALPIELGQSYNGLFRAGTNDTGDCYSFRVEANQTFVVTMSQSAASEAPISFEVKGIDNGSIMNQYNAILPTPGETQSVELKTNTGGLFALCGRAGGKFSHEYSFTVELKPVN